MASSPPFGINELEDVLAWTLEFSIVIGWKMDLIVSQGNNYYFVIEMFEFFLKIETRGEILFIISYSKQIKFINLKYNYISKNKKMIIIS